MILQIGQADFFTGSFRSIISMHVSEIKQLEQLESDKLSNVRAVVLIQQTPDQYSSEVVKQLALQFPLSHKIVVYGPWCEGDGRNRNIFSLAMRVPWYDANSYIEKIQNTPPLPLTISREELFRLRYEGAGSVTFNTLPCENELHIISSDRSYARCLKDALSQYISHQISIFLPGDVPMTFQKGIITLYDLDDEKQVVLNDLTFIRKKEVDNHFSSIFGLAGFPHEHQKLAECPMKIFSKLTPIKLLIENVVNFSHSLSKNICCN